MSGARSITHAKYIKISEISYILFSKKVVGKEVTAQLHFPAVMHKTFKTLLFMMQT